MFTLHVPNVDVIQTRTVVPMIDYSSQLAFIAGFSSSERSASTTSKAVAPTSSPASRASGSTLDRRRETSRARATREWWALRAATAPTAFCYAGFHRGC